MSPKKVTFFIVGFLLVLVFVLAACEGETVEVTREVEVEVTRVVEVEVPAETDPEMVEVTRVVEVEAEQAAGLTAADLPIIDAWSNSPHNRGDDEAFTHWDEDGEVEVACAKCHSTPGFIDFVGADGSEAGVVDAPAPLGSTIECEACHNPVTSAMDTVEFPSGAIVTGLADEARCMQCHQGRSSTVQVNASIEEAGLMEDPDTVSEDLGFINIHYYAAAATKYGTWVKGGFEYDGKSYDALFNHVEPYDTCIDCHDPHTLEVQLDECTACHQELETEEDLVNVRTLASSVDYDGDGNMEEGVAFEIETLQEMLNEAIMAYAGEVVGTPIVYDSAAYPYFFVDTNEDGEAGEDEANFGNSFASWTPRLLKAAYNYQVSKKDPGQYAHGGKYIIQLLYDSIEDLNSAVSTPVDLSNARRIDHGHFAGSEEAFRHWDEDGMVPASCSKCHSAEGLPLYLQEGTTISFEPSNGFECTTCHSSLETWERYPVEQVTFPSGATVGFAEDLDANLCLNCHQGRQAGSDVDAITEGVGDDETSESLRFLNIHYFAAGATLFGSEVNGGYQYADQAYAGRFEHVGAFNSCIECHNTHALEVEVEECANCHEGVETFEDLQAIRISEVDYDGDGDAAEGIAMEVETMQEMLYAAIQEYAANTVGTALVYDSHSYPYYFVDTNENGESDADEANFGNQYNAWTPTLLRAAYNYQYVAKDPGGFAHNGAYVIQLLYDSMNALGADVSGMTRPEIPTG